MKIAIAQNNIVQSRKEIHLKNNIVNIDDYRSHEVSELICLKCFHRWIGVYPESTLLKDLECKCGEVGYVIKTGQTVV